MLYSTAEESRPPESMWSLKRQIRALGILFLVTILFACGFAVELVRNSDAARITDAQHQLEQAATQMQARYEYLAQSFQQRNLPAPDTQADNRLLTALTACVLSGMPRVEGGFYFKTGSHLVDYAYPTYQGSGIKTDIPPESSQRSSQLHSRRLKLEAPRRKESTLLPTRCSFGRSRWSVKDHRSAPSG
jgi:hypothetical protein